MLRKIEMKSKIPPRISLVIIAAVFLLPLMLAWLMYNGTIDYRPAETRNFGQLVEPPLPLDWQNAIRVPDGELSGTDTTADFREHWVILYPVPDPCLETCLQEVSALRQIHRASGRHQDRMRIVLLLPGSGARNLESILRDTYSRFELIRDPADKVRSTLQRVPGQNVAVYLIDPLGNIMMTYEGGADPNNIKQDLKRLLTWSKLDEQ
jgi:cytochrome oxidase Cu insertion factor (SCO1/SenC/PrrC family)